MAKRQVMISLDDSDIELLDVIKIRYGNNRSLAIKHLAMDFQSENPVAFQSLKMAKERRDNGKDCSSILEMVETALSAV